MRFGCATSPTGCCIGLHAVPRHPREGLSKQRLTSSSLCAGDIVDAAATCTTKDAVANVREDSPCKVLFALLSTRVPCLPFSSSTLVGAQNEKTREPKLAGLSV